MTIREMIYRDDCDFFAPSLGTDEMISDMIVKYHYQWDEERARLFALDIIRACQNVVDTAPTAGNIPAFRCEECRCDYIDYKEDGVCPNCGISRKD